MCSQKCSVIAFIKSEKLVIKSMLFHYTLELPILAKESLTFFFACLFLRMRILDLSFQI